MAPRHETAHVEGPLTGVRVLEAGDETIDYCGLILAGLGAEVIKVEPPEGSPSRRLGPFLGDQPDPDASLHFWNYNRGKRSIVLDWEAPDAARRLTDLLAEADVLLDSTSLADWEALGLPLTTLTEKHPHLVIARLTPFGDTGPWSGYHGSDLVHLALGGVVMNCGYDALPDGSFDLPPVAPQAWHAYQIAAEQLMMGIAAALLSRRETGLGQVVSCAVHEAVAKTTEVDLMTWVMRRAPIHRQTCRHAAEAESAPVIVSTKDGRWLTIAMQDERQLARTGEFLKTQTGDPLIHLQVDRILAEIPGDIQTQARRVPGSGGESLDELSRLSQMMDLCQRFAWRFTLDDLPWRAAQAAGLLWAPLLKPHENLELEHWRLRGTFTEVEHPELGRSFDYATSRWVATETGWVPGRRAPLLAERTETTGRRLPAPSDRRSTVRIGDVPSTPSALGAPFPLNGVRVLDFGWYLASAGGTRFLSSLGAEVIKVEFKTNPDTRMAAMAPIGGRPAREAATGPLPGVTDPDMGGQFNNKNPGKLGLSLNVRHPKGLEIARRLVAMSDIVSEGFSPGVLEKWGMGYDELVKLNPRIIVAKQSGMGTQGSFGRFRTIGQVAAAFSGLSELSGFPEPAQPAGWGYSYLDWIAAYSFAQSMLTALYYRDVTGKGQYIDASQTESGIYQAGAAVLDWSANQRAATRTGNRARGRDAAPHGVYRCLGEDRWIAIACLTEQQWTALAASAQDASWSTDPRFSTLASRLRHQDELDRELNSWTAAQEAYPLMHRLQQAGVPAGVCQTAEDRCDNDPQLAHLGWLTEVTGTKIGRWPVAEMAAHLSRTPAYAGGRIDRGAPCYGEDNHYILGHLLGLSSQEISELEDEGVI